MPVILEALDGAGPVAANWLRGAIEAIADRELGAGHALPLDKLGQFLLDVNHQPRARRLAFELIARIDPATADKLLTGMLTDPSPELRYDAVRKIVQQGDRALAETNQPAARLLFRQALTFAREVIQVDDLSKKLRALGETVDLPNLFGFVMKWKVIGPFDSVGGKGWAAAFPPEQGLDFGATYDGKLGPVHWQDFVTTDDYGIVSMNQPFKALKGVAAYACAAFDSAQAQEVELRLGSENSWKVWLNGEFLFGQDEYHRNKAIDQYRMPGHLRAGKNFILVKVCQNEQTEDWAGDWDFQLRVCDRLGAAVHPAPASGATGKGAAQ